MIIPLWPAYYMPTNPQNTLSQTALKFYNGFRSIHTEALDWIRFTDTTGKSTRLHTNSYLHNNQKLDYIDVSVLRWNTTQNLQKSISNHLQNSEKLQNLQNSLKLQNFQHLQQQNILLLNNRHAIINTSFTKQHLDWTILHRRCAHISDEKLTKLCKLGTMNDLPSRFSSKFQEHR